MCVSKENSLVGLIVAYSPTKVNFRHRARPQSMEMHLFYILNMSQYTIHEI